MSTRSDLSHLVRALAAAAAFSAGCGGEPANHVTPIDDAGAVRDGEDPTTREPRTLNPESLEDLYLETGVVRNDDGHGYGEVILFQTPLGPDQIPALNAMPGYGSLADYRAGMEGVVLVTPQAFASYLFGPAGAASPGDEQTLGDGPNRGKSLLGVLQEAYRRTGIEAMNLSNDDAGAIRAADQLTAIYQALFVNDTGRGVQFDPANPIVGGRTAAGTPFLAYPILVDGGNPALFVACGGCMPLPTPEAGLRYDRYSPMPVPEIANVVDAMVELGTTGF